MNKRDCHLIAASETIQRPQEPVRTLSAGAMLFVIVCIGIGMTLLILWATQDTRPESLHRVQDCTAIRIPAATTEAGGYRFESYDAECQ